MLDKSPRWVLCSSGKFIIHKKNTKKGKKLILLHLLLGVGASSQGWVQQNHFSAAISSQLKYFLDFMQQRAWDFPMDFGPVKTTLPQEPMLKLPIPANWIFPSGKCLNFFALSLFSWGFFWLFLFFFFWRGKGVYWSCVKNHSCCDVAMVPLARGQSPAEGAKLGHQAIRGIHFSLLARVESFLLVAANDRSPAGKCQGRFSPFIWRIPWNEKKRFLQNHIQQKQIFPPQNSSLCHGSDLLPP